MNDHWTFIDKTTNISELYLCKGLCVSLKKSLLSKLLVVFILNEIIPRFQDIIKTRFKSTILKIIPRAILLLI